MPWALRDRVHCTLNGRKGVIIMIKHRKKGKLGDFNVNTKLYDIRFGDGSILINVDESSLNKAIGKNGKQRIPHWVRVGDVVLCEKGLGIIRYVGKLPGSKGTWMGMELKDDDTSNFSGKLPNVTSSELNRKYFLGTPNDYRDEMKLERDVLECHNGYYKDKKLYNCPRGMGFWLRDKDIQKIYSPEEVLMQLGWLNLRLEELQSTLEEKERQTRITKKESNSLSERRKTTKNLSKPGQYGQLSKNKPHNRKKSKLAINYRKMARSRFELVSPYSNKDKGFFQKLEVVEEGKS